MLSVVQDWLCDLNFQQQTVLLMALRGPDGFPKQHQCKPVLYFLRACVCKSAPHGRPMRAEESLPSYMDFRPRDDARLWDNQVDAFDHIVDMLPLHYFTHFMHATQILAYKHPDPIIRLRWFQLYERCGLYLHMPLEDQRELDHRLRDFGRKPGEVKP